MLGNLASNPSGVSAAMPPCLTRLHISEAAVDVAWVTDKDPSVAKTTPVKLVLLLTAEVPLLGGDSILSSG